MSDTSSPAGLDFIRQIIAEDIAAGKHGGRVVTRFPPEPNGYLHIGHATSICLNFGVAQENDGITYLRFDDTNPGKESIEFVRAIEADIRWLSFDWGERLTHASDYFDKLYDCALDLIRQGKAYVDDLSADEIREYRGTLKEPGRESPWRNRTTEDNLGLFERMRNGEFADGEKVLRAKIDMSSPNMHMRDPTLYRIRHIAHQRTGDKWCIYPMYDFAHGLSDAFEGITHSLCTLEFEDHRPLYDWLLDQLDLPHRPRQYEFSRTNLAYTVTSKRRLAELVQRRTVAGWDDPRMPTLAGMRRRGYPPAAIREFSRRVGITKKNKLIEMGFLEATVREVLDPAAPRVMGVLEPLKVTITNFPEGRVEQMTAQNHPNDPSMGERELPFSRTLWIDRDDFMEDPPKKFFRLRPGGEVRLRYAYIIRCDDVVKDADGNVVELLCSYDPETRSGAAGAQRKVKGTIHWLSADQALAAEVRLYDRLFTAASPGSRHDWHEDLNPDSLQVTQARIEAGIAGLAPGEAVQFERLGYFTADPETSAESPVFNRIVTLRDSWAKIEKQAMQQANSD